MQGCYCCFGLAQEVCKCAYNWRRLMKYIDRAVEKVFSFSSMILPRRRRRRRRRRKSRACVRTCTKAVIGSDYDESARAMTSTCHRNEKRISKETAGESKANIYIHTYLGMRMMYKCNKARKYDKRLELIDDHWHANCST